MKKMVISSVVILTMAACADQRRQGVGFTSIGAGNEVIEPQRTTSAGPAPANTPKVTCRSGDLPSGSDDLLQDLPQCS